MSRESWSEWFISKIKEDLRERVTTLDEIWGIMIFSPEKQSVAESAARIAEEIIRAKDREIVDLKVRISELEEEAADAQQELARRREKIEELRNSS
jgi:predicted  nucleic acid-binding Zn-ribbon protein